MANLTEISPDDIEKLETENIIMIDVRREGEFIATGIIKNSIPLTFFDDFGNYDIEKWLNEFQKYVKAKDQKFILICAHANRTRMIGTFLLSQGYTNVAHLEGGMAAWLDENRETVAYK
ncbi:rhodanese-like domain-containing protein [Arcobacter vandammei]|uniref:rhodanese-like domain-containing protein n=1 Tax=Arcobacter vandammei TaxID=2782243 RepID=UPI0018DFFE78|nr:rhodanese-like domain-containing protein [Arcobacter vandammei]